MNLSQRFWDRLASIVLRWPAGVIAMAAALTAGGASLSARLRVDADLWKLLPPEYPSYRALERLRATVGGENPLEVVIESPSFEANRSFAESLIPRALASRFSTGQPFFRAESFRRDAAFLEHNALYFATTEELTRLTRFLEDLKSEGRRRANPFNRARPEADARLEATADSLRATAARLPMGEYPVSADSTVMVVRLYPGSSQADLRFVDDALNALERVVAELAPAEFHPAMTVRLGGRYVQEHLEAQTIARDGQRAAVVGVPVVLLLVLGYFGFKTRGAGPARLAAMAGVICVPLVMSIVWTYGLAYLAFGALNVVTTTIGLVLFGVGVDYGIHFFAVYADARAAGRAPDAAIRETFQTAGGTTVAGAATTVAALFVLAMADFRAFREFGVLTGTGIVLSLVAMLVVLPALAVLADRRGLLFGPGLVAPVVSGRASELARPRRAGWTVLLAGLVATVGAVSAARHVEYEYDSSRLQPSFPEYRAVLAQVARVYPPDGRQNPAYIVADSPGEVGLIMSALREKMSRDSVTPTILSVESLQDRFPMTPEAQRERLNRLAEIRALLDGAVLSRANSGDLRLLRRAAETTQPLTLDRVPGHLTAPFRGKDGNVGNLIQVYSSVDLTDTRNSMALAEDIGTITTSDGRSYHAASMAVVAADMVRLMQREILQMVGICLAVIVGVMLVTFRSLRWTAVALVPTVLGLLWMLGVMAVSGMRLNFFNLVSLPVVLGVGDDTGVHLVQAFRAAPPGARRAALRSATERVLVAALTTVAGFGALMVTQHPGIVSIGMVAALGIMTTLVAGIVFMPRLLWLLLILAIVPVAARAQASLVPADHPVYEWLRRQRALGNAPAYSYENLPLTRNQIVEVLRGVERRDTLLSGVDRTLQRQYAREFVLDTALLRHPNTLTQGWDASVGKIVRKKLRLLFSEQEPHAFVYGNDTNHIVIDHRWGAGLVDASEGGFPARDRYSVAGIRGYATLQQRFGFHLDMTMPAAVDAVRFHPQWGKSPEGLGGHTSIFFAQGFASWNPRPFAFDIGTGTVRLGLGAREAVVLRTYSPNFTWFRFRFETKVMQYTFLHGALDSPTRDTTVAGLPTRVAVPRWIAARRYQMRPVEWFQFALTEALTYSNRGIDPAYLNPVYPLKVAELDTGDKDNPIWFIDAVLRPLRGVELYATLGIDDMYDKLDVFRPTGRRSNNDHTTKLLYQGGADVAIPAGPEIQVEYLRIEPFFYTHFLPLNTFETRGFAMANDLGPNADEWWLAVRQWMPWRGWVRGSVRIARQGLNPQNVNGSTVEVGGSLASRHNGQAILFLAGDVHHWHTWGLETGLEPVPGISARFEFERRVVTLGNRIQPGTIFRGSLSFSFYPIGFLLGPLDL